MVYPDIADQKIINKKQTENHATAFQRLLAVILDYFILSPILSFMCVVIFSDGLSLYKSFPKSSESQIILFQVAVGYIFLLTLFQTVFICLAGGTPGQIFTKTYIQFDSNSASEKNGIFFQAWFRQIGFVVSVLFLGLPFVAILYHPKRRAVYERMTESSVMTRVQNPFSILNWGLLERRYISVFVTTFLFFIMALGAFSFKNFYQKTLSSNLTFEKMKKNEHFCKDMDSIKQDNRLTVAIALNLIGVLSDRCLDLEADFVLWRNFSSDTTAEQKSMAYFSKFITAENDEAEEKYLKQVCFENSKSQACELATAFSTGNLQALKGTEANLLTDVLKYEFSSDLNLDPNLTLKKIEKYATHKLVNKFVISESLNSLKQSGGRAPASENDLDEKIQQIQKRIDEL
jgi:hypothetical protein